MKHPAILAPSNSASRSFNAAVEIDAHLKEFSAAGRALMECHQRFEEGDSTGAALSAYRYCQHLDALRELVNKLRNVQPETVGAFPELDRIKNN